MAAFLGAFRQVAVFPSGPAGDALMLAACVALGAAIYTTVLFMLWATGGYPRGAEATIAEFIGARLLPRWPALARLSAALRVGK